MLTDVNPRRGLERGSAHAHMRTCEQDLCKARTCKHFERKRELARAIVCVRKGVALPTVLCLQGFKPSHNSHPLPLFSSNVVSSRYILVLLSPSLIERRDLCKGTGGNPQASAAALYTDDNSSRALEIIS